MAVIDVLAVGVARLKGPAIGEHLRRLNRELEGLRSGD
jgi:RpiR family carbohydrate utilization transcriptional regulator